MTNQTDDTTVEFRHLTVQSEWPDLLDRWDDKCLVYRQLRCQSIDLDFLSSIDASTLVI